MLSNGHAPPSPRVVMSFPRTSYHDLYKLEGHISDDLQEGIPLQECVEKRKSMGKERDKYGRMRMVQMENPAVITIEDF
ncbi:uncharacterized protein G2W53_037117 [Senna tora]|uniref:Uncharacterized protein n=1 Tax=Senna tora TaxID=362788 RepID=A0A834T5W7_9FABA|nr:uncharacterized protein G2W53_037117 [Senna tora]